MNGTIVSFFEKQKKMGGVYLNVAVSVDGNQTQFLCTDEATMAAVRGNIGKPMEFYTFKSKDGSATFMSLPKEGWAKSGASGGGFSGAKRSDPARVESFACSYAKDIAVALINAGLIKQSTEIKIVLEENFDFFMGKLGQKS
jgi:hypothetical protein